MAQSSAAGRAFRFDGINDYAFVTNFDSIMPTGAVTIEWWMSVENYTNQFVFALNPEQSTNRLAFTGPGPAPSGRLAWERGNTNAGGSLSYLPPVNLSNSWQHFAVVADPAGAGSMRIYRNGVQEAGRPGVAPLLAENFLLELGGSSVRTQFLRGQLDEVRVWNTARTAGQIQFHRHRPLTNTEPGLVAYYRFDETTGALVADSSTNGLHAVLTNASTAGTRNASGALLERPVAVTYDVTNATLTTATLGGAVTTHYWTCGVWFAWGPLGSPTNVATPIPALSSAPPLSTPQVRGASLLGLQPGITYEVRLFVSNGVDVASGAQQTFKTLSLSNTSVSLPGVSNGVAAWGDFDSDGDLDLLLAGQSATNFHSAIYRNDSGDFTPLVSLPVTTAVIDGAGAWGDVDNDGDLDALLTGRSTLGTRTYLFRNEAGTNFTTTILPGLPGYVSGSLALGDYDSDGDLDVLVTGDTNAPASRGVTAILRNSGGSFTNAGVTLRGVFRSQAAWMDYNRDGWLDLVLAGESDTAPFTNTLVYRNLGPAGFTNAATLRGTRRSAVAWGDFDRNSAPDLAVVGATNTSGGDRSWSGVYNYISGDIFSLAAFAPLTVYDGAVAWGDYDNDGGLDLVVTGNDEGTAVAALYRHQSGSTFVNSDEILTGLFAGTSVAWGDYDGDGDLDLLLSGATPVQVRTFLHVNHTRRTNAPPTAPGGPFATFRGTNGSSVVLGWARAVDLETTNLTYNVRMGTNSGGVQVVSPHSDPATGRRLLPAPGNFGFNDKFGLLTNLNPFLTHYWSVQAVDGAFQGGPWAPEQVFHYVTALTRTPEPITPTGATLRGEAHPYGLEATAWFEWGTNSVNDASTLPRTLGPLLTSTPVSAAIVIPEFPPRTTLYCRLVVSNAVGTLARGAILIFETPWLVASMGSVSNGLAPGQFNACLLSLTNLTGSPTDLTFSFEGGTPAWLGVTGPATLAAGATTTLGLVFNALALAPGTYATTLVVSAAGLPDLRVPVSLLVGPAYTAKPGDLNKDGVVDLMELNTVIQYYRGLLP